METNISRRNFMQKASVGLGAGALGLPVMGQPADTPKIPRLPREVWIGSVSMVGMKADNAAEMVRKTLDLMEAMVPFQPDIICLPECFAYFRLPQPLSIPDVAEQVPGPVVKPFQEFARTHQCYIICPTYSRANGQNYIAAILIDRAGKVVGEYRKSRPTADEMAGGVRPGPLHPPVFQTDFGKIGIQICFDIKWDNGWEALKEAGAEIIFWPSAYAAGREINSRAWRHQVYVVSSTQTGTAKICDITGEVIAQTGSWQPNWTCGPVNLEKAFLHTWPAVQVFNQIQQKYGRRVKITTFDEEEWTTLESLDPLLKVAAILEEFKLKPHHDLLKSTASIQQQNR